MIQIETGLLEILLSDPEAILRGLDHPELRQLEQDVNTFGSPEPIAPPDRLQDPDKLEEYYSYSSFLKYRDEIADLAHRFAGLAETDLLSGVSALFAPDGEALVIHLLPVGHSYGDAYVHDVDGLPAIFVNLACVAKRYGQNNAERWQALLGVLEHEVFHVYFARLRARSGYWHQYQSSLTPAREAQLVLLDEGIGHFIGNRDRIPRFLEERDGELRHALAECEQALARLAVAGLAPEEAAAIILGGTVGSFFAKHLSIAGMLAAYAIFRSGGYAALRSFLSDPEGFREQGLSQAKALLGSPRGA